MLFRSVSQSRYNIINEVKKRKGTKKPLSAKARILAGVLRNKLKSKPPILFDEFGNEITITQNSILSWNELVEFGAKALETSASLLEAFEKTIAKLEEQEWYQKLSDKNKEITRKSLNDAFAEIENDNIGDDFKISKDILYDLVERGLENNKDYNIDNLVDDVYDLLNNTDLDKRTIRDIITGYGVSKELSKDEIDIKIRELKRDGKLLSSYEDVMSGKLPERSGLQRDTTTPKQRELQKLINEELKKIDKRSLLRR